ncbi:solute carrier family 49 member A3-like isoform X5 [Patiria miniata]|uniref:Major facilitator superfamily (MFS) profile domain-containing protein n=1 Tax=Patiria miniata TaxID=46514 RepID=A0A914B4T6_PATMI|nr:solute carrier family 49 member A3-like isoform X5 [Patiria miniata]
MENLGIEMSTPSTEEFDMDRNGSPTHVNVELVDGGGKPSYRLYKMRWWVLATLSVLNFSNAMAWICFAAITNFTAAYYHVTADDVNWLSLIYLVVAVPVGFVTGWVLDTFGIRTGLWVYIIPAAVACAMCTLGVHRSTPPTPPTASAAGDHESFYSGMKKCVRNVPFMILLVTFGGGYAIFNALSTFMEQIVCPIGYNDDFAGLVGGMMIAFGLVGAIIAGLIVDRTQAFTPVTKICFTLAVLSIIGMALFTHFDNLGIPVAIFAVGFGLFGFAMFPIALELGVECTYPVAEGTSSSLLQISGQFQGIILILIGQFLAQPLNTMDAPVQQCIPINTTTVGTLAPITLADNVTSATSTTERYQYSPIYIQDMSVPLYVYGGYAIVICLILVLAFRTTYRRIEAEQATNNT